MDIGKLIHSVVPPCPKCPYTLGQVRLVDNPCPDCKLDNYEMYCVLTEGKYREKEVNKKD